MIIDGSKLMVLVDILLEQHTSAHMRSDSARAGVAKDALFGLAEVVGIEKPTHPTSGGQLKNEFLAAMKLATQTCSECGWESEEKGMNMYTQHWWHWPVKIVVAPIIWGS